LLKAPKSTFEGPILPVIRPPTNTVTFDDCPGLVLANLQAEDSFIEWEEERKLVENKTGIKTVL